MINFKNRKQIKFFSACGILTLCVFTLFAGEKHYLKLNPQKTNQNKGVSGTAFETSSTGDYLKIRFKTDCYARIYFFTDREKPLKIKADELSSYYIFFEAKSNDIIESSLQVGLVDMKKEEKNSKDAIPEYDTTTENLGKSYSIEKEWKQFKIKLSDFNKEGRFWNKKSSKHEYRKFNFDNITGVRFSTAKSENTGELIIMIKKIYIGK